jgi:hypothetical protein
VVCSDNGGCLVCVWVWEDVFCVWVEKARGCFEGVVWGCADGYCRGCGGWGGHGVGQVVSIAWVEISNEDVNIETDIGGVIYRAFGGFRMGSKGRGICLMICLFDLLKLKFSSVLDVYTCRLYK